MEQPRNSRGRATVFWTSLLLLVLIIVVPIPLAMHLGFIGRGPYTGPADSYGWRMARMRSALSGVLLDHFPPTAAPLAAGSLLYDEPGMLQAPLMFALSIPAMSEHIHSELGRISSQAVDPQRGHAPLIEWLGDPSLDPAAGTHVITFEDLDSVSGVWADAERGLIVYYVIVD